MTEHDSQPPNSAVPDRQPDLARLLSHKLVGQPVALDRIIPYIHTHQSGLSPEGRPVGVFLLLGPTGTGKTKTVEALAEVLHGDPKMVLKVNCGEFQSEHEVAKLIGAPPGYVGHAESQPRITQAKLDDVRSPDCDLALVLFDEIEKADPAVNDLLLGILDKATLQLGDGAVVDFESTLIFLTSNLGAREMMSEIRPSLGFQASAPRDPTEIADNLERIGTAAVRKQFSPEFVNRIDVVIAYRPLDEEALSSILDQHVDDLRRHVHTRLGDQSFEIALLDSARAFLLEQGTSTEYGARELNRTIHRHLTQPLASMVITGNVQPGAQVEVTHEENEDNLTIKVVGIKEPLPEQPPVVLVVDDNEALLRWFQKMLSGRGYELMTAPSISAANTLLAERPADAAFIDCFLPDGNGVELAMRILRDMPIAQVIIMSGATPDQEDRIVCEHYDLPVMLKPFVAQDVVKLLEARLIHRASANRQKSASG